MRLPSGAGGGGVEPLSSHELSSLLERTSRTFALTIPLLEEPIATDVGVAYLLLRVADTLEDAPRWGRDARVAALEAFSAWLRAPHDERAKGGGFARATHEAPTSDAGCTALLARAENVRASAMLRGGNVTRAMLHDVVRTSTKMADFVARQTDEGDLVLRDVEDLKAYCYAVAGIVGELLTTLFILRYPALEKERDALMTLAPAFGEGLQLVNILKDETSDACEGRSYVPPGVSRESVIELARASLAKANDYVGILARAGGPVSVRRFCELPVRLAEATLLRLAEGSRKLTRAEVMTIFSEVTQTQS